MSYRTCPDCGAALDPGERCDCWEQPKSQAPGKKRKKKSPGQTGAEEKEGRYSMSKQKQAPESAETYRRFIHQFVDEISDVNTLWTIYSIVLSQWKMKGA